jgi:threonine synthase
LQDVNDEYGYITDPHTAVALSVSTEYAAAELDDDNPVVVVSTASPYKFVDDVLKAIGSKPAETEVKSLKKLEKLTALPIPDTLLKLPELKKLHTGVIEKEDAKLLMYAQVVRESKKGE